MQRKQKNHYVTVNKPQLSEAWRKNKQAIFRLSSNNVELGSKMRCCLCTAFGTLTVTQRNVSEDWHHDE